MKMRLMITAPLLAALFCLSALLAQDTSKLSDEHWELWKHGIESYEEGEFAVQDKKYEQAIKYFNESLESLKKVKTANPSWNKNVMNYRISVIERKIRNTEEKLADRTKRANSTDASVAETETAALRKALADTRKELASLRQEAERGKTASSEMASLLKEKEALEQRLATLTLQYNTLKLKADSNAPGETENALRSEKQRSALLEKTISGMKDENLTLLKQIQSLSASLIENEKASREISVKAARVDEMEKSVVILRDRLASLEAEGRKTAGKNADERKALTDAIAKKTTECELLAEHVRKLRAGMKLDDAARALEAEAVTLRAENDRMKREAASLKSELEKAKAAASSFVDGATRNDVIMKSLSDRNSTLSAELEKLKKSYSAKTDELSSVAKMLEAAKKENERIAGELKTFAYKINNMPSASAGSEAVEKRFREEIVKIEAELKKSTSKTSSLEKEKATLLMENTGLKEKLLTFEKVTKDASSAENELRKLMKERTVLTQKLASLENAEKERAALAESNAKLVSEIAKMDKKFVMLKKDADNASSTLENENLRLKTNIESLKSELSSVKKASSTALETAEKAQKITAENTRLSSDLDALRKKYDLIATEATEGSERAAAENKRKTAEMAKTLRDYEAKLASAVKSAETTRKVAEDVAAERNTLARENVELKKDVAVMKAKVARADEIVESEALLSATMQENKLLKARYEKLKGEKKDPASEQAARDALRKLEESEKKLAASVEKTENLEQSLEALKNAMTARSMADSHALESVKKELAETLKSYETLKKAPESETSTKLTTLENKVVALLESEKHLNAQLAANAEAMKKIEAEKSVLKNDAIQAKEAVSKLAASHKNEIDALKKSLFASEASVKSLKDLLDTANKALAETQSRAKEADKKTEAAEKRCIALENEFKVFKKEMSSKSESDKKTIDGLKRELANSSKNESGSSVKVDQVLNEQYKRLEQELVVSEKRADELLVKTGMLKKDLGALSGVSAELKKQTAEVERLKRELTEAKSGLVKRESVSESERIKQLTVQLETSTREIENLKKQLDASKTSTTPAIDINSEKLVKANALLEKMRIDNSRLAKAVEDSKGDSARLKTVALELAKMKDERAVFITELEKIRKELSSTKNELTTARAAADDKTVINSLKSDLAKANSRIADLNSAAANSAEPLIEMKAKLAAMEKMLGESNEKILRQNAELRKYETSQDSVMKEKLARKDQAIDGLMKEHVALANDISTLRSALKVVYDKAVAAGVKPDSAIEKLFPSMEKK